MRRLLLAALLLWAPVAARAQTFSYFYGGGSGGSSLSNLCGGSGFTLQDATDGTKKIQCLVSGNTTGVTSTIAFADASNATHTFQSGTDTIAHLAAQTFTGAQQFPTGTACGSGLAIQIGASNTIGLFANGSSLELCSGGGANTPLYFDLGSGNAFAALVAPSSGISQLELFDNGAANPAFWTRIAAGTWQAGSTDAAAPVAQTLQYQSVVGGTSNTAAPNATEILGKGTGTGVSGCKLLQAAPPGASGTTQNTPVTVSATGCYLVLANNIATTIAQATLAATASAAVKVSFGCHVTNGTDIQDITGETTCSVANKAGVFTQGGTNGCAAPVITTNPTTSGTLTATVTMTGANPSLVQINCNSSLTPSTGYPLARYDVVNLGWQALAITQ